MGEILLPAFQYYSDAPVTWGDMIKTFPLNEKDAQNSPVVLAGEWTRGPSGAVGTKGKLTLAFDGNRIDITTFVHLGDLGTARVLIDGKKPSAHAAAYAATLPSSTPIDYHPAIMHVVLGDNVIAETWTLTAHDINDDGTEFAFDVKGSVTGPDGSGTHKKPFVSDSGRIQIHPDQFTFAAGIRRAKRPLPEQFDVTWQVYLMGLDELKPENPFKPGLVPRQTVIQGIANGPHTLEIVLNEDGPVPIESVTVHRPSL
jgi:hypothetical protein